MNLTKFFLHGVREINSTYSLLENRKISLCLNFQIESRLLVSEQSLQFLLPFNVSKKFFVYKIDENFGRTVWKYIKKNFISPTQFYTQTNATENIKWTIFNMIKWIRLDSFGISTQPDIFEAYALSTQYEAR